MYRSSCRAALSLEYTAVQCCNTERPPRHILDRVLLERLAVELAGIAESANLVQYALGKTMDQVSDLCEIPIVEFQALDQMQQKLEDLSKLSLLLADAKPNGQEKFVTTKDLRETLRLASLTRRLEGRKTESFEVSPENEADNVTLF